MEKGKQGNIYNPDNTIGCEYFPLFLRYI